MKLRLLLSALLSVAAAAPAAEPVSASRAANTIVLDPQGVKNLGLEFATVEETDFEEIVFALGRIEEDPERHAVLSSRIAGRIVALSAHSGERVNAGQEVARVESRQPGNPPPAVVLTAPRDGVVVSSHVHMGDPVEPSSPLLEILDLREVRAVARVPEHQASRLVPGKTLVRIRVPALGGETLSGELLRFGTAADRESGTIDAIFRVANTDERLRPGMRAEFAIVVDRRKNRMSVPRAAIQGDPSNRFVYVKDFDLPNAFLRTPVQLGLRNDRAIEITNGLFPGDEVVTTGSYLLGFAGGGAGISLKEALDAAHGHEHNADGSEVNAAQRAAKAPAADSSSPSSSGPLTLFFALSAGVLLVLLVLSVFFRRPGA